jgi:ATP-dependent protease ClpP protease subunit
MENSADKEIIVAGGSNNTFTKVIARQYSFYLSGEVKEPEEYIEWFDTIRNAGPDDDIVIHINSMGGNLDTALQFIRVLSETQGCVTTSIEGSCMSAATMIFLQGQNFQISPFSLFMTHNY